jgi:four helix bundle protein
MVKESVAEDGFVRSYRDLWVWKEGMELAEMCYGVTKAFPREEAFGMTSQVRRAATAIPANIAANNSRFTTRNSKFQILL